MTDGTEKPRIPSKFAIRAARSPTNLAVSSIKIFASPTTRRCTYPVAHPGFRREHSSG